MWSKRNHPRCPRVWISSREAPSTNQILSIHSSLSPFLTHLPADTLLKEQNTQEASWFQKLETNG